MEESLKVDVSPDLVAVSYDDFDTVAFCVDLSLFEQNIKELEAQLNLVSLVSLEEENSMRLELQKLKDANPDAIIDINIAIQNRKLFRQNVIDSLSSQISALRNKLDEWRTL